MKYSGTLTAIKLVKSNTPVQICNNNNKNKRKTYNQSKKLA